MRRSCAGSSSTSATAAGASCSHRARVCPQTPSSWWGRRSEGRYSTVDEVLVKHVERKIIEHLLQNRLSVLVENTCISASSRTTYLSIARQMHRTAGVVFLDTPVATCLERNRARADPVPERVIAELAAALERPDAGEGFDQVMIASGH